MIAALNDLYAAGVPVTKLWEFFGKELEKSTGKLSAAAEQVRILGRDLKVVAEALPKVPTLLTDAEKFAKTIAPLSELEEGFAGMRDI